MSNYVPFTQRDESALTPIEKYMRRREELVEKTKTIHSKYEPVIVDGIVTDYGISPDGEVFSYLNCRPLQGSTNIDGKKVVTLCYTKNGNRIYRRRSVDHMVATAYIPNPDNCKYVCHYDNDPLNCNVSNLYWTKRKDISTHGFSKEDVIDIYNSRLNGIDCETLNEMGDWVKEKFDMIIWHIKDRKLPEDPSIIFKGFRRIQYNGVYSEAYEISPFGIIHNIITDRYMFGSLSHYGYPVFISDVLNKRQSVSVHRLVASTFIPNPHKLSDVHHMNSNILDSCVWNLQWLNHKEHIQISTAMGGMTYGEDRPSAKYTNDQIHEACRLIDQMIYSPNKITEMTGVDYPTIKGIRAGNLWKKISMNYNIPVCRYDSNDKLIGIDPVATAKTTEILSKYRKAMKSPITKNNIQIDELLK